MEHFLNKLMDPLSSTKNGEFARCKEGPSSTITTSPLSLRSPRFARTLPDPTTCMLRSCMCSCTQRLTDGHYATPEAAVLTVKHVGDGGACGSPDSAHERHIQLGCVHRVHSEAVAAAETHSNELHPDGIMGDMERDAEASRQTALAKAPFS